MATRPSFEEMNLNKLSFSKEMEFAIQIFQGNDYLTKMTPDSIRNSLVNIALSGLSLNPALKFCYLVPRKGKCCVDVSYVGMIKLLTDTGSVKSIRADISYEKDTFDIELGNEGFVKHKPYLGAGGRGKPIAGYSIATLNDGSTHIEFMTWDEIMAIKARSESVKSGKASPWDSDTIEMARKTVLKKHFKYLPKSERALMAANAIAIDHETNGIDFKKEQMPADINETLDTEYEEIVTDNIPKEAVDAIKDAKSKDYLGAIWKANAPLQEFPEFLELINKRVAELDLEAMQKQHNAQPETKQTEVKPEIN